MKICLAGRTCTDSSVVALGMFDGVHIGHRTLLKKARKIADEERVPLVVQTFAENPLRLLAPGRCPPLLTTPEERARLMESLGVDIYCAPAFTEAVRDMPPEDFVGELVRRWHPVAVVAGFNYTFGRAGEGSPALLRALGGALGFETIVVPAIGLDGHPASATGIRNALAQGRAIAARRMLGRPYARTVECEALAGGGVTLRTLPDGKQSLPAGEYRALLDDGLHAYPVLVRVSPDGSAFCRLPPAAGIASRATLRYVAERPV